METDIATRLRSLSEPGTSFDDVGGRSILKDAADEIERLIDLVGWASKQWQETHAGLTKATRWIPVEERLPSEGSGGVLGFRRSDIAAGEHSYGMAWNHGGKLAWNEPMTPTHWMPLPAPPTSLDAVREQWYQLHKGPRPMPEVE